jgi:hypothetical protein
VVTVIATAVAAQQNRFINRQMYPLRRRQVAVPLPVTNRKHLKKGSSRIAIEKTERRTARSHVHDHSMIERDGWHRRCSLISIVVTSGTHTGRVVLMRLPASVLDN